MFFRLLLTGLLAATLASAQSRGGGGRSGANMPDVPTGDRADKLAILADNLKLDKDHRKLVRTTLDEGQKEAAPLRDEVIKTRQAIAQAITAGKSQEEIDQLVKSHAAAESRMAALEMKAFVKIYQGLDEDQKSRAGQMLFPMMSGIFKGKNWNE